jgi:hypothetical protein
MGWWCSCANYMPIAANAQGRSTTMGQAQQKRRAVLILEDNAELRSLRAVLFEDEQLDITDRRA